MAITVSNVVEAVIQSGCREAVTRALNQYDYGQVLTISGIELPEAYEVHFSNASIGSATTSIGNAVGVSIPNEYLTTGKDVHAWIYLHAGEEDGETLYHIRIPVIRRARAIDADPTPAQQSVIDQAIAALNVAVVKTRNCVEDALTAEGWAKGTRWGTPVEESSPYYHHDATYMAGQAEDSATAAAGSAGDASDSAGAAAGSARDASDSAGAASGSAAAAAADALEAEGWAKGTQNGSAVASGSPYYQDNSKYYKEQAASSATAAETAAASATAAYGTTLLAPTYSTSGTYAVGDYCIYNGNMYRCTTAIPSGESWTSGHWTQVAVGSEVGSLKSAIQNNDKSLDDLFLQQNVQIFDGLDLEKGYYLSDGTVSTDSGWLHTKKYDVTAYSQLQYSFGATAGSAPKSIWFNSDDSITPFTPGTNKVDYPLTIPNGAEYVAFSIKKSEIGSFNLKGTPKLYSFFTEIVNDFGYAIKTNKVVIQSNYATVLPNANTVDANTCIILWMDKNTSSIPQNLPITKWPADFSGGALLTFYNETTSPAYGLQIFYCGDGTFIRVCANWSNKTWLDWGVIGDSAALSTYKTVQTNTISTVLSDANNAINNKLYVLWLTKGGTVPANFPFSAWNGDYSAGFLFTAYTGGVSTYGFQVLIAKGEIYGRIKANATTFLAWEKLTQGNAVVHVAHNTTVSNLVKAVDIYGENTTFVLSAEDYDIEAMYKAYYGNDYFTNYNYSGGYAHTYDMGLFLKPGCKIIGESRTRLLFNYDGENSKVNQYFSIIETTMNNEIDNIELVGANDHFRYHIHDDMASTNKGTNHFHNLVFTGTPNQTGCIGGGMGNGCTYIIENCLFNAGNVNSMYYHSPSGGTLKNKIIVRGCYCETAAPISFWWYGTGTYVTDCYAYNNRANVECRAHTATPHDNVNMKLYEWNNVAVE